MKRFFSIPMYVAHLLAVCLLFACMVVAPSACADQASSSCFSTEWPWNSSVLQPDPDLVYGRLENGLRYIVLANQEPKGRVAMYLRVGSGSLHEHDQQQGLAHYLEHMLFNGSTHYPPGKLIQYLQSIGMNFGADSNAYTTYDETVYNLLLPSASADVLDEGLLVLSDYARGALLVEAEVERERGIILAEKRTRDSAQSRVIKAQLDFDFAGTLVPKRRPIGQEEVIRAADSALLRDYYDRWYRPDNMLVVVVGDMDPQDVARRVQERFSSMQGKGQAGLCPDYGQVEETERVFFLPEPELGHTALSLVSVFNTQMAADSPERRKEDLKNYLAMLLLNRRMQQLEQKNGQIFAKPFAANGIFLQRFGYAMLSVRTEPDAWQKSLTLLQETLTQALRDGFGDTELARGKKELMARLEKEVQTASSKPSQQKAMEIIRSLGEPSVPLSPLQEMALYAPMLEQMTSAEVHAALRKLWDHPGRLVELVGLLDASPGQEEMEQQIHNTWRAIQARQPMPWVEQDVPAFPYLPEPAQSAALLEQHKHDAVGIESSRLEGGIHVNCKSTDFQKNQVVVSVHFGPGQGREPLPGISLLAESLVRESGTAQLDREQFIKILAGTSVKMDFRANVESFVFSGSGLSSELPLLLQIIRHRLQDPSFGNDDFIRSKENLHRIYRQMDNTVEGVQQTLGQRFLSGGSAEYGMPSWQEVEAIQLDQVQAWLQPFFLDAPLEINVVGDVDPKAALALVQQYFGEAKRTNRQWPVAGPLTFPLGQERSLSVESSVDKAFVTVAWLSDDYWDIARNRRLNLLAAVLNDRLRMKVREELGAAYSIQAFSAPSRVHPGFGMMISHLTVQPDQALRLAGVVRKTASQLAAETIGDEELQRALQPTLTHIRDMKRNNRYWLETVMGLSSRHPDQLQWPINISEDFASITADELQELALRYLRDERAASVIVTPADTAKKDGKNEEKTKNVQVKN